MDEATKLDKASIEISRKSRDKNPLLENEMSNWMLASLQKAQIVKASGGNSLVTGGGLSTSVHVKTMITSLPELSPAVIEFTKSLAKSGVIGEMGSPQKMLPFQDFYKMFQEFNTTGSDSNGNGSVNNTTSNTAPSSPTKTAANGKELQQQDAKKRSASTSMTTPVKPSNAITAAQDEATAAPATATLTQTPTAPVNILKQLAEKDANFEVYMRVAKADQDDNELKHIASNRSASNLSKPRRLRKVAPLGMF